MYGVGTTVWPTGRRPPGRRQVSRPGGGCDVGRDRAPRAAGQRLRGAPHRQTYTSADEARALGVDADEVLKPLAMRTGSGYALMMPPRPGLARAVEEAALRAMATSTTPGLAVALVHHGQVAWAAGYGAADQATGQPVTATTRFQAASLSKPVTAWGVLRLVEQGQIGLDDPAVGHLRGWRPPPSPFQAGRITIRRLLSHTAGLSVHGYTGQAPRPAVAPIELSLPGETGGASRSSC